MYSRALQLCGDWHRRFVLNAAESFKYALLLRGTTWQNGLLRKQAGKNLGKNENRSVCCWCQPWCQSQTASNFRSPEIVSTLIVDRNKKTTTMHFLILSASLTILLLSSLSLSVAANRIPISVSEPFGVSRRKTSSPVQQELDMATTKKHGITTGLRGITRREKGEDNDEPAAEHASRSRRGRALDAQSKDYMQQAILVSSWNWNLNLRINPSLSQQSRLYRTNIHSLYIGFVMNELMLEFIFLHGTSS